MTTKLEINREEENGLWAKTDLGCGSVSFGECPS